MARYNIVYKTTNRIDGKYYVGCHQTDTIDDGYLGSGKLLSRAIKKYGVENFSREILHIFDNKEEMFSAEEAIVNESLVRDEMSYNLKIGGSGGNPGLVGAFTGMKHSIAVREHLSRIARQQVTTVQKILKLKANNWARRDPEAQRNHARLAGSTPKSAEHRQKIADSLRGKRWTKNQPHPNKGKSKPKTTCPHCGKTGAVHAMSRWHFGNCQSLLR